MSPPVFSITSLWAVDYNQKRAPEVVCGYLNRDDCDGISTSLVTNLLSVLGNKESGVLGVEGAEWPLRGIAMLDIEIEIDSSTIEVKTMSFVCMCLN